MLAEQHGDAADVVGLEALWQTAAANDLFDGGRVDAAVSLQQLIDYKCGCLVRTKPRERSFECAADRCTDGIDDYDFGHYLLLDFWSGGRTPRTFSPAVALHGAFVPGDCTGCEEA